MSSSTPWSPPDIDRWLPEAIQRAGKPHHSQSRNNEFAVVNALVRASQKSQGEGRPIAPLSKSDARAVYESNYRLVAVLAYVFALPDPIFTYKGGESVVRGIEDASTFAATVKTLRLTPETLVCFGKDNLALLKGVRPFTEVVKQQRHKDAHIGSGVIHVFEERYDTQVKACPTFLELLVAFAADLPVTADRSLNLRTRLATVIAGLDEVALDALIHLGVKETVAVKMKGHPTLPRYLLDVLAEAVIRLRALGKVVLVTFGSNVMALSVDDAGLVRQGGLILMDVPLAWGFHARISVPLDAPDLRVVLVPRESLRAPLLVAFTHDGAIVKVGLRYGDALPPALLETPAPEPEQDESNTSLGGYRRARRSSKSSKPSKPSTSSRNLRSRSPSKPRKSAPKSTSRK